MRALGLAAALALVLAACGDTGGDLDNSTTTVGTEPPTTVGTAAPAASAPPTTVPPTTEAGACPDAPFTGTISRTAASDTTDGTHVVTSRTDGEIVSAYAYDFGTGDTYTVYVGDYDIDAGGVGTDTLVAPEGGLLATIFVFDDTPLEPGSSLELGFVPIVDTGGGATVTGFGADEVTGSVTIIAVTDATICFDIDTTDPQQRLAGTVSAELVS